MTYIFFRGIILGLFWFAASQPVFALADVKSTVEVTASTVTLGDLFDNLESGQDIWIMNSPKPGQRTSLSTRYLANFTRKHNVYWQNSHNIQQITISRKGKSIEVNALKYLVEKELTTTQPNNNYKGVTFDNNGAVIYLPEGNSIDDITLQAFHFNPQTNKFSAKLSVPQGDGQFKVSILNGRTYAVSYVPTLNKTIAPGKEITNQDISWTSVPTLQISRNMIREKKQIIGMTPRRGLNPSTPVNLSDLIRPKIISRGKMVQILFQSGKITLTATGKAIEEGGRGDVIRVMNNKSHKTIEAVIIDPTQVQVIAGQNGYAQLNSLP